MSNDSTVTPEGIRFIKSWFDTREAVEAAERSLSNAKRDEREAHDALVKWLLPEDAKPGEKIAVWFGDSLIQVEAGVPAPPTPMQPGQDVGIGPTPPKVTIRTRGKQLDRALLRMRS